MSFFMWCRLYRKRVRITAKHQRFHQNTPSVSPCLWSLWSKLWATIENKHRCSFLLFFYIWWMIMSVIWGFRDVVTFEPSSCFTGSGSEILISWGYVDSSLSRAHRWSRPGDHHKWGLIRWVQEEERERAKERERQTSNGTKGKVTHV